MGTERTRELRRRRHRKKQVAKLVNRAARSNAAEKAVIAGKLRRLTPGGDAIIENHGIEG
jgi:hypothetical protein